MKDKEKKQIAELRHAGLSYVQISKKMDLSINSIKSYCQRHGLGGDQIKRIEAVKEKSVCEQCGKAVRQNPGRKHKRFCSDKCRLRWWNSHLDQVKHKANYELICQNCKKEFTVYGDAHRKYCCHECYIEDRFGKGKR